MRWIPFAVWFGLIALCVHWRKSVIPVLGWVFVGSSAVLGLTLAVQQVSQSRQASREMTEAEVLAWLERNAWHPETDK